MSGISHRGMSLETLRQRLMSATGGDLKRAVSDAMGTRAQQLALDGFRKSKGPAGEPWKPVARRGKPLIDTGHLRQSMVMEAGQNGFKIGVRAPYAGYQQFGTRSHPRAGRILRQNARGRFVKVGAKTAYLVRHGDYTHPGITPRPMLPLEMSEFSPVWGPKLRATARKVLRLRLKGGN